MNKDYLEKFIDKIESLIEQSDKTEYVQDLAGCYLKVSYLQNLLFEAKELIKYGEDEIALENMLDNLSEVSILMNEDEVNLARLAFDGTISSSMEQVLKSITK